LKISTLQKFIKIFSKKVDKKFGQFKNNT